MAGRAIGVATVKDLAEYFRLPVAAVGRAAPESGLLPVTIEGWDGPGAVKRSATAWADPAALEGLGRRAQHRTTLLSPFDSLIWDRARTARLFGFTHRLEAYTPSTLRVHGYYVMPLLAGGRLIGRVDPKRAGKTLVARQVSLVEPLRPERVHEAARALQEAGRWVGCDAVVVERSEPERLGPLLRAALESD